MHTWAFSDGYAGGPVCGFLIKRNLSQVVSKACRQPEGSAFRNGPFAKGGSLPELGQFELESGQFGPESTVQQHAAVYDPLHPALQLSPPENPITFLTPENAAGNKRTSDTTTHAWHSSPFCSIHSVPTEQSDQLKSTLFSCAQKRTKSSYFRTCLSGGYEPEYSEELAAIAARLKQLRKEKGYKN